MEWTVDCSAAMSAAGSRTHPRQKHSVPEKFPVCYRHLQELCCSTSPTSQQQQPQLMERVSIKAMDYISFLMDGLSLYIRNLRKPSTIPGRSFWSRAYAMGLFPFLATSLIFVQWVLTLVIILISYTSLGKKTFRLFMRDQLILYDPADPIDPSGTEEALQQLSDIQPKEKYSFSYYLAHLFLNLSALVYERDDKLVRKAAGIMKDMNNENERTEAAAVLQASEEAIDFKAQLLGMRFMGISELKSLGGPYAGLFYNDESIVLVFKGTSVLAFNEYLLDLSIQRVDAREFLYGEAHKGFYEALFPDPMPKDCYEYATFDRTNPFQTIMDTIFEIAKKLKEKSGKPVNLWITGHSLGKRTRLLVIPSLHEAERRVGILFGHDRL
ncbi:hypothetical protein BGZ65_002886 [Modicella reniformis]|uniref:Fungal lipase-type domain-containing protein n=1 Tax=Modicella reniformis TaxID=1440133 RepID=A0A9P6MLC7_9FUNG|nr:hypothetical protein BGZ65_002886 [Modicella reniformis]